MMSDKQKLAMTQIDEIVERFGVDRWFVQAELPGITQLSMNALVNKGYLEKQENKMVLYYRRIKSLEV